MLKIVSKLIEWLNEPADLEVTNADPLMHPALQRMSPRELGDLPIRPGRAIDAGHRNCPA